MDISTDLATSLNRNILSGYHRTSDLSLDVLNEGLVLWVKDLAIELVSISGIRVYFVVLALSLQLLPEVRTRTIDSLLGTRIRVVGVSIDCEQ